MKTIKPQRLSLLLRTIERGSCPEAVISVLVFFALDAPDIPLSDVALWKTAASTLREGVALDDGLWKPRAEVLVTGTAYPPSRQPSPAWSVRLKIGAIDKTLWVVGKRTWDRGAPTDPEPISSVPLDYAHAFGGAGYARNPIGTGYAARSDVIELPNVEDPRRLLRSPTDTVEPSGFGPYDCTWPQRSTKGGTYDATWLETRFPGYPADLDPTFFNTAPEDQQIDAYWKPGDAFSLENLHPERALIEGRLPLIIPRTFIHRGSDPLSAVPMVLDTVHFLPCVERGIAIFRGVVAVEEDDASDIKLLVAALEDADRPKPVEHYERVVAQRLDRDKGHLYALRDRDLLPDSANDKPLPKEESMAEMDALLARSGALEANMRRRAGLELEKARATLREQGLDPDAYVAAELSPVAPQPSLDELPDVIEGAMASAEDEKRKAEAKREEAEREARRLCTENGLDYEKLVAEARAKQGGPPRMTADGQIDHLRQTLTMAENAGVKLPEVEAMLADPSLRSKLLDAEKRLREAYVRFAHSFTEAPALVPEDAKRLRDELIAARRRGESLARRDLTGADLSGLDLTGVNARGAFLEGASLAGADLSGADFSGAVLARADLSNARLVGTNLSSANLGGSILVAACLEDADLTDAVLAGADLSKADFAGATLTKADLSEACFAGASFARVRGREIVFLEADLSGVNFKEADLTKAVFLKTRAKGARFDGATLASAAFLEAQGDGASFIEANLENLRLVSCCSFRGSNFAGARLRRATLRETDFTECDFSNADLSSADLSGCRLSATSLYRVTAQDSRFVKADLTGAVLTSANLMNAIFQRATLHGADLRASNLFRADLLGVKVDGRTNLEGAELGDVRFVKEERAHG